LQVEEEKVSSAVGQIHADLENSHQEDEERFFESIREVAAMEIQTGKNEKGNRRALLLTQQSDARTKRTKVSVFSVRFTSRWGVVLHF